MSSDASAECGCCVADRIHILEVGRKPCSTLNRR